MASKGTWLWIYINYARITNTLGRQESNVHYGDSNFKEMLLSFTWVLRNTYTSAWTRCPDNVDLGIEREILSNPILSLKGSVPSVAPQPQEIALIER